MEREIEFKGLKPNGLWVYGLPIVEENNTYIVEKGIKQIIKEKTLGQYTGIKDIKQLKIYEKDIVLDKVWDENAPNHKYYEEYYPIIFKNGIFCVDKSLRGITQELIELSKWKNPYVVGNLATNSDLLQINY